MNTILRRVLCCPIILLSMVFMISCSKEKRIEISVTNPNDFSISDAFVSVEIDTALNSFSLFNGKDEIPYQILFLNEKKEIGFVMNLNPSETKVLTLETDTGNQVHQIKSRTYAELAMKSTNVYIDGKFRGDEFKNVTKIKVPKIHTDHDALFKYEGPGWESEKVGYRFYLDWRNANDIFGKKVNALVLENVGTHDTVATDDSYHSMLDWGMDIFKVGNSLGIGSIGMWYDGKVNMVSQTDSVYFEIPYNGPFISEIKTSYFGWRVGNNKYDLVSSISIAAGSRLSNCKINISKDAENIVTGLVKSEGTNFIAKKDGEEWAYIALYGTQTLVDSEDKLGIAVFYRQSDLIELSEDSLNHIIKLKPDHGKVEYSFCAAWEQEPDGITNEEDFIKYLDRTLALLNNPIVVKLN
jgi:Domain of unknown function (DUF4861)